MLIINKHQRRCPAESTAGTSAAGHEPRSQAQRPWAGQGWESNACRESWRRRGTGNPRHPAWAEVRSLTCGQPVESRRAPAPRRDHALHPLGFGRVVEAEEGGLAQADGAPWGEGEERAQPPHRSGAGETRGRSRGRRCPALRCVPRRGAGSCRQQRLRGRLKSRSPPGSCRRRGAGAGTAGVPAGGHAAGAGGAGGPPGPAWLPAADKTAPVPGCKAPLLGPKQQPSQGKAAERALGTEAAQEGERGCVLPAPRSPAPRSPLPLPAVPGSPGPAAGSGGRWKAPCRRHTPL